MKIRTNNALSFQKKPSDMADYYDTLKRGKEKAGNLGKSILIIPSTSLPNKTGAGNLACDGGFFDFAKQYWGINEVQILPSGQYHFHDGKVPIYSGTSMDLGNHLIDIKSYVSDSDFQEVVRNNKVTDRVNHKNIITPNSSQEKVLWKLYDNIPQDMRLKFENYKKQNADLLEPKALYRALSEINGTHDYKKWQDIDKNLFNQDFVNLKERAGRVKQIYELKGREIDFYKFKQFLAEDSLKRAREKLNSKGIKLNGDMICGFSYDEVWANPKAFLKDKSIGWGLPALDLDSKEAEMLLRKKVNLYAERFDGLRVDASWTYVNQPGSNKYYGDKILNIIDDEVRKVKGSNFDLRNVMHEFAAGSEQFRVYDGSTLRPCVKDRVKIYTSDWLSKDWGSNDNFISRGWAKDSFIIGVSNHDSHKIEVSKEQADALSKILKIPKEKLMDYKEFLKAKFAEPAGAYNNMIFYSDALGLERESMIKPEFEAEYHKALQEKRAYNPMDALEKTFKAHGLDKEEPDLYKKIVKYRKILEKKDGFPHFKIMAAIGACLLAGLYAYVYKKKSQAKA